MRREHTIWMCLTSQLVARAAGVSQLLFVSVRYSNTRAVCEATHSFLRPSHAIFRHIKAITQVPEGITDL